MALSSVLVTQDCCPGADEGWTWSQFPLLSRKLNENANVNLSHP